MADKTLVYVGTEAGGLYRKEAGDDGWQMLTDGLPQSSVDRPSPQARAIAIHPQNPEMVYVGTQRGVYRSPDRGDHWDRMDLPEGRVVWSLKFHPDNPQVMYLGTEGCELFRSDDGGSSWQYIATIPSPDSAPQRAFCARIIGLAIEPSHPDNMYAALEVAGVARSADAGKTWEVVNRYFAGDDNLLDIHGVAVGSPRSDAVFASNRVGVWRSRDRGDNWENLALERFSTIVYSRGIQSAPDDSDTFYACIGRTLIDGEGGVLRTTDLGETWHRFDRGVNPGNTTMGVAVNAQHPDQVYFCTRLGQVFGTHDGGDTWKGHPLPEAAVFDHPKMRLHVISIACASV